jgi:hypothetical protein
VSYYGDALLLCEDHRSHEFAEALELEASRLGIGIQIVLDGANDEFAAYLPKVDRDATRISIFVTSSQLWLDDRDFAPEWDSAVPASAAVRLERLTELFVHAARSPLCLGGVLALTDSMVVDDVRHVAIDGLAGAIKHDCAVICPPNAVYVWRAVQHSVPE